MIQWLAVLVAFSTSPDKVEAGIIRQGNQYADQIKCEEDQHKKNEKLAVKVSASSRTTVSPIWICLPVVE